MTAGLDADGALPPDRQAEHARLVADASPFLAAEGFSNRRIDELASAFLARGLGDRGEDFADWALGEGRLGPGEYA